MANKILVLGNSDIELYLNMYRLPEKNETVVDDGGVAYTPGGRGVYSAIAAKRLGADSVLCTKLGPDAHGQKMFNFFKEMQLDTSYIKVDREHSTGFKVILAEADADRYVYYPGANNHLSYENLTEAFSAMPDALYINFETQFDTALMAAKIAAQRKVPIFVDATHASKEHPLESLPEIEVFSPNEQETFEYTGVMPLGSDSSLRAALALWKRLKCKYIVIKQGERGSFIYDGKHYSMIPPYRPDCIKNTTALGDVFTTALTVEYLLSGDIVLATKYATAASAVSLARSGGITSLPTESEVVDFLKRRPG